MPCLRRKKRVGEQKDNQDDSENTEKEDRVLQRILRRVSALSSIIIKFLRDIREGIFRLFRLRTRVSSKYTKNIDDTISNDLSAEREEKCDGAKTFEFSTAPRSYEWNPKAKRNLVRSTNAEVHLHDGFAFRGLGDKSECTSELMKIAEEGNENHDRKSSQKGENTEASDISTENSSVPTDIYDKIQDIHIIYTPGSVRESSSESDEKDRFYQFVQTIDTSMCKTEKDREIVVRKIMNFIQQSEYKAGMTTDMKAEVLKKALELFEKALLAKAAEKSSVQRAAFQVDESGVIRPMTSHHDQPIAGRKPTKAFETGQKHNQTKAEGDMHIDVATQVGLPESIEKTNRASETTGDTTNPTNHTVANKTPDQEVLVTEMPKPSSDAALKERLSRSDKTSIPESRFVVVTDPREVRANQKRFVKMITRVVKHCVGAFLDQTWKYQMELAVSVHLRPNGESDWNPLFKDSLFEPETLVCNPSVSEIRSTRFVRLISLEQYVSFVGMNPTAEEVLQTLESVILKTTIVEKRKKGQEHQVTLKTVDELHWCLELLDVMTYISYYVLIGCSKIVKKIHATDTDIEQRQILAKALHDHVIQKFDHSLACIVPRMRHAIDNFCLKYEGGDQTPDQSGNRCQVLEAPAPIQAPLDTYPLPSTPKKHLKRKGRITKASNKKTPIGDVTSEDSRALEGRDTADGIQKCEKCPIHGTTGLTELTSANYVVRDMTGQQTCTTEQRHINETTHNITANCKDMAVDRTEGHELANMNKVIAADVNRIVEWDFADYVNYIETNNTLDYGCLEVMAGHGERPNKKKLASEIKEKIKTKGIPNKHLEHANQTQEFYSFEEDDETGGNENETNTTETKQPEEIDDTLETDKVEKLEAVKQTIDDREFNMVPEEVIRKDESKLKDLEDAYNIGSSEKKKDKHKKKKEKKSKAVKLQLDFEFPDPKRR